MKLKIFLSSIILLILFSACGNHGKLTGSSNEKVKNSIEQNEASASEYKGYVFEYNGIMIEVDAEAESLIKRLGEPESYFEVVSCVFEGIDRMYTYRNFEIDTYPVNDIDYISAVIFKDDSITTAEGIGIGDSIDKVTEIYGVGNDVGGMLVYEKDSVKLCFIIREGVVASVEYRTTVLHK